MRGGLASALSCKLPRLRTKQRVGSELAQGSDQSSPLRASVCAGRRAPMCHTAMGALGAREPPLPYPRARENRGTTPSAPASRAASACSRVRHRTKRPPGGGAPNPARARPRASPRVLARSSREEPSPSPALRSSLAERGSAWSAAASRPRAGRSSAIRARTGSRRADRASLAPPAPSSSWFALVRPGLRPGR